MSSKFNSIYLILLVNLLYSCTDRYNLAPIHSKIGNANGQLLNETIATLEALSNSIGNKNKGNLIENDEQFGKKAGLFKELVDLFDPNNFSCGCDDKVRSALKRIKHENQTIGGFIPNIVKLNAFLADTVILFKGEGSNILAHSFQYVSKAGVLSKPLYARTAITADNFDESSFIEKDPGTYDNFLYTLDCSGFLSAAISATGGTNANSMKASASAATNAEKSLLIISGVMYSPLYQAFKGEGIFSGEDSLAVSNRISVLSAILNEIPFNEMTDSTIVTLNSNYQVIITSNSGTSSFNGEAKFDVTGKIGFGIGSISGNSSGKGSIDRRSEFTRYKTYLVKKNVGAEVPKITVLLIKNMLIELKKIKVVHS